VPPIVHDVLRSPGQPLEAATRADMEPRFGHDFSRVRVHTDARAAESARAVNALAYTVGHNVAFAAGRYVPRAPSGRALLAHELCHVLRQPEARGHDAQIELGAEQDPEEAIARRAENEINSRPTAPIFHGRLSPEPPPQLTLRRQTAMPRTAGSAAPESDADLIDSLAYPDWDWYLLNLDTSDTMPTLSDAREAVGRWRPELIPLLRSVTATQYQARGQGSWRYWALRHPTAGVLARVSLHRSGQDLMRNRLHYGVYAFMSKREAQALYTRQSIVRDSDTASAGQGRLRPAAPQDPLLDAYFRRFLPRPGGTPTSVLTRDMRVQFALSLADRTLFGSVYDAAMEAIRNPWFFVQTAGMIAVYVGLWLTPSPGAVTQAAAAALTMFLLTMFTWQDIIGFARAWFALEEAAAAARTEEELQEAGNRFMRTLGQVGFDVFLMALFWGLGRAARPRLRAARNRIAAEATGRAQTAVAEAEAVPGSGGKRPPITAAETDALAQARTAAGADPSPAQVLDALADRLPEAAREGLRAERAARPDARTLGILEARSRGRSDIFRWLEERAMTGEQAGSAQQALIDAQARLARARLVELRALENFPSGQRSALTEVRNILLDLGRSLRRIHPRLRRAIQGQEVDTVIGELGEALARGQLAQRLLPGQEVVSSLELARRVPGYRTVAEWAAAERAAGHGSPNTGRMRQGPDGIYESVGQIDNAVARRLPDGRLQIIEVEETKTGRETGQSARTQVERASDTLSRIGEGTSDVRIMERRSSTSVGRDLTGRFDLGGRIEARTRGPEGRAGFDRSLDVSREDLTAVARQILAEGVPPVEPGAVRRVVTSGPGRREPKRERESPQATGSR
jgi:hypothetical protein